MGLARVEVGKTTPKDIKTASDLINNPIEVIDDHTKKCNILINVSCGRKTQILGAIHTTSSKIKSIDRLSNEIIRNIRFINLGNKLTLAKKVSFSLYLTRCGEVKNGRVYKTNLNRFCRI